MWMPGKVSGNPMVGKPWLFARWILLVGAYDTLDTYIYICYIYILYVCMLYYPAIPKKRP